MIRVLPYLDPPRLTLGPLELNWSHAFWSLGTILMFVLYMRRVEEAGRDGAAASELFAATFLSAVAGTYLISTRGLQSSFAVAGGVAGALLYFLYRRYRSGWPVSELVWLVDAGFAEAPLPLAALRMGCLFEHAHAGIRSESWLAVNYPGGPRWDLALLEVCFFAGLWGLFRAKWIQQPWRVAVFLAAYGLFRAAIEPLRIDYQAQFLFPMALTVAAGIVFVAMFAARRRLVP